MLKCFLFIRKSLQIFSNQWLVLVIDASKASLTIVAADKMERVSRNVLKTAVMLKKNDITGDKSKRKKSCLHAPTHLSQLLCVGRCEC